MKQVKLIALDLDGTLFDSKKQISKENIDAINKATELGIHVVISTGRPFIGIPFEAINNTGIKYAITTNGAAIYDIETGQCISQDPIDQKLSLEAIDFILSKDVHMDAFIEGKAYSPLKCYATGLRLSVTPEMKSYILGETRTRLENLSDFIVENDYRVQKFTLNFANDDNGVAIDRKEVYEYLTSKGSFCVVSGGYNNLEFTRAGVDKGVGLKRLAGFLKVPIEQTMAIGDTENDLAIIKAAGIGVAMGNATPELKAQADYVTLSNEESGVAAAIKHFVEF